MKNMIYLYIFQGCLWGGRMPEVIDMMEELDRRTQDDLKRDMIAKWHDESQMNKFFSGKKIGCQSSTPCVCISRGLCITVSV